MDYLLNKFKLLLKKQVENEITFALHCIIRQWHHLSFIIRVAKFKQAHYSSKISFVCASFNHSFRSTNMLIVFLSFIIFYKYLLIKAGNRMSTIMI